MHPTNLVELLQSRAATEPLRPAYTFLAKGDEEQSTMSYGEVDMRARSIAAWLQAHAQPGDRVLLLFEPGLEYIASFFGCVMAGMMAVPAYPPRQHASRPDSRVENIVRDAGPSVILCSAAGPERRASCASGELSRLPWQGVEDLSSELACGWRPPQITPDAIAFLQYTSGSTSAPRGVMVSHSNLIENQRMIQEACGHDAGSTFVGWLPLYHDMGLIGNVLQPLFIGARCILMSPSAFAQKPVRWLRAISKFRAHTSGGPNFAYDHCVRRINVDDCEDLDLSSWTVAFNGAEPVRAETMDRFSETFAPLGFRRNAFTPCYGLAEATLIVSCKHRNASVTTAPAPHDAEADDRPRRSTVGCGPAVIDTEIAVVHVETGEPCAEGQTGEIWIHGSGVAQGYWNRAAESDELFRATMANGDGRTFLRTGDRGFMRAGELFVTGRLKDLIIIRGMNHHAEDIEWSVQQVVPAARAVVAFATEVEGAEKLVVVIELERSCRSGLSEIEPIVRRTVAEAHEVEVFGLLIVPLGVIPRTSSGKIQRRLCRRLYHDGELETVTSAFAAEARSVATADIYSTVS